MRVNVASAHYKQALSNCNKSFIASECALPEKQEKRKKKTAREKISKTEFEAAYIVSISLKTKAYHINICCKYVCICKLKIFL